MDLVVSATRVPDAGELEVEVVERKGKGHPDTMCDALAEELSVSLCRFYQEHFGEVLHYNVDKVLLWAGRAAPRFGGGEVLEPMEFFLAGRAAAEHRGVKVPIYDLALEGSRAWLRKAFRALDVDRQVRLHSLVRPGSEALVDRLQSRGAGGTWLANDTSIGVGFAPRTALERVVMSVETMLNAASTKAALPVVGEDVKVMGVRTGRRIRITVACAFVDRHVRSMSDYFEQKERVATLARESAQEHAGSPVEVVVNAADDRDAGTVYLTVTGTSAESGDDGQAGRGNRANGLITPCRPMTLEAAAGKNPVTHVGKIYQVAAQRIAETLVSTPAIRSAECILVSEIGRSVEDPQVVDVKLKTDGTEPERLRDQVRDAVHAELARLDGLWREILAGSVSLY